MRVRSDEEEVRQANRRFYRAFERLELARMDEAWCHDGLVTCVHPGWPLAAGWEEVRNGWRTIFEHTDAIQFSITDERVDVRGELAWVVCVEWLGPRPGTDPVRSAVLATNVFRRDGAEWRMVHHHASPLVARADDRPPPPARGPLN